MAEQTAREAAASLIDYIGRSPSPWHAVATTVAELEATGFKRLAERDVWQLEAGAGYYVVRDGSSIIAFRVGNAAPEAGLRIVGAHTDSPGFRVKPRGAQAKHGHERLSVEVYGGPIIATFADRELTLAGRVLAQGAGGGAPEGHLVHFKRPLLRLPTPAIHLNREVNEQGLRFELQDELPLILALAQDNLPSEQRFRALLAEATGLDASAVLAWELAVADTQPGSFFGLDNEFIASSQLDNLASCHSGLTALLAADDASAVTMCAFFDHEEIGSQSFKGADGSFLPDTVARIAGALGWDEQARHRALASSLVLSADMAHAWHPNFARFYDEQHQVRLNGGPVLKINAKQRYATDGVGEAYVQQLGDRLGVPIQKYVHRNNLPCGSTIGPITAARLGIRTVDVGNPMWSMHSLRESAGTFDHAAMIRLMTAFFADRAVLEG